MDSWKEKNEQCECEVNWREEVEENIYRYKDQQQHAWVSQRPVFSSESTCFLHSTCSLLTCL